MHRAASLLVCVAAASVMLVGCGEDEDDDVGSGGANDNGDSSIEVIEVVTGSAGEYHFEMPEKVSAGPIRLALSNEGAEDHHAQVFELGEGKTLDDLNAALATGRPAEASSVGSFVGGTALVSAGEESRADAVLDLDPGNYVLLCLVPGPDGIPHVAHGMTQPFTVDPVDGPAPAPEADVEVTLDDYHFELPESLDGDATVAIANESDAEPHEMVIAQLDDDVSVDDVLAALRDEQPLPAVGVGGMQALPPGSTQHLQLDLEPGRYLLLCAVPSPTGKPHFEEGMVQEVTVT